jgi:hypothetical protein
MQESWRRTGNRKSFDPDTWLSSVQDSRKSSAEACDQCLSVHTHVRALGALAMLACWGWRRCAWDDPLVQRGSLSVGGEMCFPVHASTLLWIPFPPEHLLFLTGADSWLLPVSAWELQHRRCSRTWWKMARPQVLGNRCAPPSGLWNWELLSTLETS